MLRRLEGGLAERAACLGCLMEGAKASDSTVRSGEGSSPRCLSASSFVSNVLVRNGLVGRLIGTRKEVASVVPDQRNEMLAR